jgi:glycerophosphoryl diester phosphodiesterase family protein
MTDQPRADMPPDAQAAFGGTPGIRGERPLPLRQMGIGELIDAAVKLYRRDWLALIGIVGFVLVPVTFLQVWLSQGLLDASLATPTPTPASIQFFAVSIVFSLIQFLIVQPFLVAAITRAAADAYLGEEVTIGGTYRYALRKLPAILWITLLTALVAIVAVVPGIVLIVLGVVVGDVSGVLVIIVSVILLIVATALVFIRLAMAPPVLIVENLGGTGALRRSWRLTRGSFWRLLGTIFLSGLIASVASLIITVPSEVVALLLGESGWIVSALGTAFATVLITPFSVLIVVLLYFDLRIRKEGFDIEVMAQELAPAS